MSIVHTLVPNRPGILDRTATLLHRCGLRLSAITLTRAERPAWARLTLQVHEDDVHAVMRQLERHIMGEGSTGATGEVEDHSASFRWQADGARGDEAA